MIDLKRRISRFPNREVLFTDFFDTLVHRTVHPNYALRLWGKFMVRELGMKLSSEKLFTIRNESLLYLGKKQHRSTLEIKYKEVIEEVYRRLINSENLHDVPFARFKNLFENADYIAEISVQFKNDELIEILSYYKQKGYKIYLLSDFYLSKRVILRILEHHKIADLFDAVFISSTVGLSKEKGGLYPYVLDKTNTEAKSVLMIGDNKKSDDINASKYAIDSLHLKHFSHKFRNKRNLLGSDKNDFRKACNLIKSRCLNSEHKFSEYIIHFYFFTERLYINARRNGIKELFFLAREGHFLKQLFDCYQEMNLFKCEEKINTHYLKASRQSATQLALRPLENEDFEELLRKFGDMSLQHFLDWFPFSDTTKNNITKDIPASKDETITDFFKSPTMALLRENEAFQIAYEKNRNLQKTAFLTYLKSFGANYEKDGLALVDVGWGGTMQESIYKFLNKKTPVTGYYLGLKEIYNIEKDTKRFGLNFSIYPSQDFYDDILMANGQLYEQLLAAPHGSTLAYKFAEEGESPTVEYHEPNEKMVFDKFISPIQDYMYTEFKNLFTELRPIDYSEQVTQEYITDMALRTGIFTNRKKLNFIKQITKGFYQNVGENKVGLEYDPNQITISKIGLIKTFIKSPEKVFRYLVKIKPFLYYKGFYWLSWPVNLSYYYIKFNFWAKRKWLKKGLIS
ncbi:HAD family hydrolase [Zobellia russellii]|uniref:HAD family hydrolase n=1 Tax=Zobellia russellii TaxID=248907 RepID=UPI001BFF2828|nr:HAD family hydrolase [Zobellia russellii]MBT9189015.1 HAD family hydrolase [Zobellia russellii]